MSMTCKSNNSKQISLINTYVRLGPTPLPFFPGSSLTPIMSSNSCHLPLSSCSAVPSSSTPHSSNTKAITLSVCVCQPLSDITNQELPHNPPHTSASNSSPASSNNSNRAPNSSASHNGPNSDGCNSLLTSDSHSWNNKKK